MHAADAAMLYAYESASSQAGFLLCGNSDVICMCPHRYTITGRAPAKELLPDIQALQDGLLAQPEAKQWAAANPDSVLAKRMADPTDLPAQVRYAYDVLC